MKIEIKFRAWQDDKMLTSPIATNYGLSRFFGILYEDAPIMQYTGLKDKNGKEIYEGDIDPKRRVIQYRDASFHVVQQNGQTFDYLAHMKHIEVIGNIYENPELLNHENIKANTV